MAIRNPNSWMWAEACEMLERAQRLQRQFFRVGHPVGQPRWEPPADIVSYGDELLVMVALPGVAAEHVEVAIDEHGALRVRAIRPSPITARTTAVHRLEIPYGRYERRIALPPGRYELTEQACVNGCLLLRLAQH